MNSEPLHFFNVPVVALADVGNRRPIMTLIQPDEKATFADGSTESLIRLFSASYWRYSPVWVPDGTGFELWADLPYTELEESKGPKFHRSRAKTASASLPETATAETA
ncbi:MAG: hypothetical protein WB586_16660 [Chthoniobacterales bacterium]